MRTFKRGLLLAALVVLALAFSLNLGAEGLSGLIDEKGATSGESVDTRGTIPSLCAYYDIITNTFAIPCYTDGTNYYSVDLTISKTNPLTLAFHSFKSITAPSVKTSCASNDTASHLVIPCFFSGTDTGINYTVTLNYVNFWPAPVAFSVGTVTQNVVTSLSAPTGVAATTGTYTDKVRVSWNAVTNAEGYEVYRATSSGGTYSSLGNVLTTSGVLYYDDTTAAAGSTYYYKVLAYTGTVTSDFSAVVSGSVATSTLPTPTGVSATSGTYSNQIIVSWNSVTGATSYSVYRGTSSSDITSLIATTSSTTYTDTGVSAGVTYYYRIKASNSSTTSDYSSSASGYTSGFAAPTGVSATDGTYTDKIIVSWTSVSGASGYYIYRSTSSSGTYTKIDTVTSGSTTSYTNSTSSPASYPITAGTTYYYYVTAYTSTQESSASATDSGYAGTALSTPVASAAAASSSSITVSWSVITNATGYEVWRTCATCGQWDKVSTISGGSTTTYTDVSLPASSTYSYRVRAVSGSTYSEFSSTVSATTSS